MNKKKTQLTAEQQRTRALYYAGFDFLQNLGGDIEEEGHHIRALGVFGHACTDAVKEHLLKVQKKVAWGLEAIERLDAESKREA